VEGVAVAYIAGFALVKGWQLVRRLITVGG
jgi:hypothetical protein